MVITIPISQIPKTFLRKIKAPAWAREVRLTFEDGVSKRAKKLEVEKSFEVNSKKDFEKMVNWLKNEN